MKPQVPLQSPCWAGSISMESMAILVRGLKAGEMVDAANVVT